MPTRSQTYARWALAMKRSGYFRAGERVGVAVSGGPDSILLLDFLKQYSTEAGLKIAVVHFNHHLRGAEADADEEFVKKRAESLGLEFFLGEADVAAAARARRRNLEATARELRYRFFLSLLASGKLDKVATAHTANDQAETVLLRLLRGTGTRGLGGIYPSLEGKILRPFLELTRREIETEITRRGLEYRTDATNLDTRLQRNKVRRELLPLLEREFNPEAVTLLRGLADRARDDEDYLEKQARELALPWLVREGRQVKIPLRPLLGFPPALQRRALRQMLQTARGDLHGISHRNIEEVRHLAADAQSGKTLALPGACQARREFDWLIISAGQSSPGPADYALPIELPGEVRVPGLGIVLSFKIVEAPEWRKTYNKKGVTGLDPQKLRGKVVVRNWRPGDRFQPAGSRRPKKLKELLARRRIPLSLRRSWPVMTQGENVVWARGIGAASSVTASQGSRQVLVIEERVISEV